MLGLLNVIKTRNIINIIPSYSYCIIPIPLLSLCYSTGNNTNNPIRGFNDYFPPNLYLYEYIESICNNTSIRYNYSPIRTPIVENIQLFNKSMGNADFVLNKEMFVLNNEEFVLRPEGTAGVIRACINNNIISSSSSINSPNSIRYSYLGPMFRYERPQRGK
jgi:histidyl-tRNA synthetase